MCDCFVISNYLCFFFCFALLTSFFGHFIVTNKLRFVYLCIGSITSAFLLQLILSFFFFDMFSVMKVCRKSIFYSKNEKKKTKMMKNKKKHCVKHISITLLCWMTCICACFSFTPHTFNFLLFFFRTNE